MEEQEEKRKRTVSEREEEDDGTLVGPLPVEHSADDKVGRGNLEHNLCSRTCREEGHR